MATTRGPSTVHSPWQEARARDRATGWIRANLFGSWPNSTLTVVSTTATAFALFYGLRWVITGADWTIIGVLGGEMIIGQYNAESSCPGQNCIWRPQVALLLMTALLGMIWGMTSNETAKRVALGVTAALALMAFLPYSFDRMDTGVRLLLVANIPAMSAGWAIAHYGQVSGRGTIAYVVMGFILSVILLRGLDGIPGLHPIPVSQWGGLTLNLLLAIAGITISLPIGTVLALGRRSELPVVKLLCIAFIEVFRGVPLITLLFMSQVLVPLAFPEDFNSNSLVRAGIIITLFSSAYMAENIRGGLQKMLPGQVEAARELGLPSWQATVFISLPQAMRNAIPAMTGQFISLYKDTTLIYIVGMLDILEISRAFIQSHTEYVSSAKEMFIFLALVFWVFNYTMSYISKKAAEHLDVGQT